MAKVILSKKTIIVLSFLFAFFGGLYVLFPVDSIEITIREQLNSRIPDPLLVNDLEWQTPRVFHLEAGARYKGIDLTVPVSIRLLPGLNFGRIDITSPPPGEDFSHDPSINGQLDMINETVSVEANTYPLSLVLKNQSGFVSGTLKAKRRPSPSGTFQFRLTEAKLKDSPVYPRFLQNLKVISIDGKGSINDRQILVESLNLTSDKFVLNGSLKINPKFPLPRTKLNVNFKLTQPLERGFDQTYTLKELNY